MGPNGLTKEDIESSFQYRILRKALKQEFKFIKDISVDERALDVYHTIFINMIVDPKLISKIFDNAPIQPWVYRSVSSDGEYKAIGLPLIVKVDNLQDLYDLQEKINTVVKKVTESSAIPEEYILKEKKGYRSNPASFTRGDFIVNQ